MKAKEKVILIDHTQKVEQRCDDRVITVRELHVNLTESDVLNALLSEVIMIDSEFYITPKEQLRDIFKIGKFGIIPMRLTRIPNIEHYCLYLGKSL